jgi:dynein heavy chain
LIVPSLSGKSPDQVVGELANEIESGLPPLLVLEEAMEGLFARTAGGQLNSLSVVLSQEVDRFNVLSRKVLSSLKELQNAIKGLVVMSAELEAMYNSMLVNQVPELWSKVGYPSLKPLASWVKDYHQRITFMHSWLTEGVPKCFWLPGFFFPQGFMTGVLQMHARKYTLPIDTLAMVFEVTDYMTSQDLTDTVEDGVLIDGLWIDGGRWDMKNKCLEESELGAMYAPIPVVHFRPAMMTPEMNEARNAMYECPLYKTSVRAGLLSTTGQSTNFVLCVDLPIKKGTNADFWILQGVALLTMVNT